MVEELRCCGTTEGGKAEATGAVAANCGAVHLVLPLPAGTLKFVTAKLPWPMDEDEKLFMNGYQTWTHCPELGKWDIQRGLKRVPKFLLRKFAFDRYGDYHFTNYPESRGESHGFSYCYFRKGDTYRLIGSLDETPGYTIFYYNSRSALLHMERDCAGVYHEGGSYPAFDLFFAQGTEQEVFDAWFRALKCRPRTERKLLGYSSWYNRYQNITYSAIEEDLAACARQFPDGSLFQIDDGWEPKVGDWLTPDPEKFPDGLAPLVEKIHAEGYQAGLWLAPFVCEKDSALYREHPDWLLKVDGGPWCCGCNWSGFYALDIDNREVLDYLETVFHRVLDQWGFDLVKLDFLYGAAPFGSKRESRAGRMRRAMELLRQWCGGKQILGCGVPLMPAFGLVDYCRVGCDVSLNWDDAWYMRLFHRERVSTKHSIDNTVFRRQLNGRAYGSDPDVFFLREENCRLSQAQKEKLAVVNGLFSGILLTSDVPGRYSGQAKAQYGDLQRLFLAAENVRVEADRDLTIHYRLDGDERSIRIR